MVIEDVQIVVSMNGNVVYTGWMLNRFALWNQLNKVSRLDIYQTKEANSNRSQQNLMNDRFI